MARILVTGASGFIGANVARALIAKSYEVTALTRTESDLWRLDDIRDRLELKVCDLLDVERLRVVIQEIQPEVVIHLAGVGVASAVYITEAVAAETNFVGLVNLITTLESVPYTRFINVGTVLEYGATKAPFKETDACEPMNMYGVTKLAGTRYASYVGITRDKPIVALRLFSAYGPYDDPRRIAGRTILRFLENKDVAHANPQVMRDFIYVKDVIELFLEIIESKESLSGEIYNVGTGHESSMGEVVDTIRSLVPTTSTVTWGAAPARRGDSSMTAAADMTKTFAKFAWRPRYSLKEGLAEMCAWMKEHHNSYRSASY